MLLGLRYLLVVLIGLASSLLPVAPAAPLKHAKLHLDKPAAPPCAPSTVGPLKQALLQQALAWQGQGDPDSSKQEALEALMKPLLAACPQPPVSKRLPLLEGAWQQVWGPYSYKNNEKRGVDPAVDPQHIYQVVFKDGSYSNVAPLRNSKGQPQRATILLQGLYQPDKDPLQPNLLHVRFVGLGQVKGSPPAGFASYPAVAKARHEGTLAGYHKVLPNWFVRWVFGGGQLTEVYTDADLRLTYGASKKHPSQRYLYILKRVN